MKLLLFLIPLSILWIASFVMKDTKPTDWWTRPTVVTVDVLFVGTLSLAIFRNIK